MALALEASMISERLGAAAWYDVSLALHHRCLARVAARGGPKSIEAMRSLRTAIVAALDSDNPAGAAVLVSGAYGYVAPTEPDTVLTFFARWRVVAGISVPTYLENAGIPVPDDWSKWEARAARLSLTDAVGLVVAALDRVIAEAEADTAAQGDP